MKKTILLLTGLVALNFQNQAQTVKDIDGNVYNTVVIGSQTWMKENLKVTQYNDSTAIPLVTENTAWAALGSPGYCWYNNDTAINKTTFGALYNWYTVNTGKLCPTGWHIPTDAEWTILTDYLTNNGYGYEGSGSDIGKSIASTTGWSTSSTAGTIGNNQASNNSSGFTALLAGERSNNYGIFREVGYVDFWSSTEYNGSAWIRNLYFSYANVGRFSTYKNSGFSARCLSDSLTTRIENIENSNNLKVFPNPTSNRIFIDCIERQSELSIYNIVGELVFQRQLNNGINEINISNLQTGIYVIKIENEQGTIQQKLIKQ